MLFCSYVFILVFLPISVIAYFAANKISPWMGKVALLLSCVFYYAYAGYQMFFVLVSSIMANYLSTVMMRRVDRCKRLFVVAPVVVNIGLLFYFKYFNFAVGNINAFLATDIPLRASIVLPAGISFFTFQQIAWVVFVYQDEGGQRSFLDYLLFSFYFPKIFMGPLMEPGEFIRQVNDRNLKKIQWENIANGIKLFSFGLFKKMMLADLFHSAVAWGYQNITIATSMDWLLIMLFYSFEIYFDFSGYSDMATGVSFLFQIVLPINFDSPYKAVSIRDFWKRWHISMTGFFTKYLYIPLGGNRKGTLRTYINVMAVFLASGIWHGANWTFLAWGGVPWIMQPDRPGFS